MRKYWYFDDSLMIELFLDFGSYKVLPNWFKNANLDWVIIGLMAVNINVTYSFQKVWISKVWREFYMVCDVYLIGEFEKLFLSI